MSSAFLLATFSEERKREGGREREGKREGGRVRERERERRVREGGREE